MSKPSKTPSLEVDFINSAIEHRRRFGGGRQQALARAIGLRRSVAPEVVDATAGLGRDAFLLASLGATVTMIERSKHVHALLCSAMEAAMHAGGAHADIVGRMQLLHGDSIILLPRLAPAIVLVDPMHPLRSKSALVKANMRHLRDIVGADDDKSDLIRTALAAATKRVVVKWPTKLSLPEGLPAPSHSIVGKTTRYDVFVQFPS